VETLKGGFQAIDTGSLLLARLTESQSLRGILTQNIWSGDHKWLVEQKWNSPSYFHVPQGVRKYVFNTVGESEQVIELL